MLQIFSNHCRELKIADSKEMMVGIACGMPFELEQFGLFHASMHIDATADSTNKEVVTGYCHVQRFLWTYVLCSLSLVLPSEQSWACTNGCSKASFQY
jgi:hypothetical protein